MIIRLCLSVIFAGMLSLPEFVVAQEQLIDPAEGVTIHVVQRGENLFGIALDYGTSLDILSQLNALDDPGSIQAGQRLLVPNTHATASLPTGHVVQAGETLGSIALLYNLTIDDLALVNAIDDVDTVYIGQTLEIAPAETSETRERLHRELVDVLHTVQPGDTVYNIATRYGVDVNAVAEANELEDNTLIFAGQPLLIPDVQPPPLALDLPAPLVNVEILPLIFVEGQTGRIRLETSTSASIVGDFLGRPLFAVPEANGSVHDLLVGVPIFTDAGIYPLRLVINSDINDGVALILNVQIVAGPYGSENIELEGELLELLNPAVEQQELQLLETVMSGHSQTRYFEGPMGLPAAAPMTSLFGTRRAYNGGAFDRFHTGTDFAAVPGTPIVAPAAGRVVLADTLPVRGAATVIDHGWGVYSGFWHQQERRVQLGEIVAAGQVIGTIGDSGRVTGAHLHWELWVNGSAVDPMQWVSQSFS